MNKYLSEAETAKRLKTSLEQVRQWRRDGKLKQNRLGNGNELFERDDVETFRKDLLSQSSRRLNKTRLRKNRQVSENDIKQEQLVTELDLTRARAAHLEALENENKRVQIFSEGLINSSLDGIFAFDRSFHYTIWNPAMERIFGVRQSEVIGRYAFDLFPFLKEIGEDRYFCEVLEGGSVIARDRSYRIPELDREGFYEGYYSPLRGESGSIIGGLAIIREITDRKRAEEALQNAHDQLEIRVQERTRELAAANEILKAEINERKLVEDALKSRARQQAAVAKLGQQALSGMDLDDLLDEASAIVSRCLDVEYSQVLELLPDGKTLVLRAGRGWKDGVVGHATLSIETESPSGFTLYSNEPLIIEGLNAEKDLNLPPFFEDHKITSGMSVIIFGHDYPFGVLGAYTTTKRRFTREDINFLQATANVIAMAIERKQSEKDLAAVKDELAIQLADMIHLHELSSRLATSVELKVVLEEFLSAVVTLQRADMGILMLYDPEQKTLYNMTSIGFTDEYLNMVERVPPGIGPCGAAITGRRQIIIEDIESDPLGVPHLEAARLAGYRAVYAAPLLTRSNNILGTVSVYFRGSHRPSNREIRLVEVYTRQAAQIIENAQLYREAQEAHRIKDEFLATVSHELRTPLTAILGWAKLLRTSNFDEKNAAHAIETIERNAKTQAQLIEDLLDISRIITGKLNLDIRKVDPIPAIRAAIEAVRPAAEVKNIKLQTVPGTCDDPIMADPTRLQQIVWNLLSNAIKFTPNGGLVEIEYESIDSEFQIVVRDNGKGINPDFLPHVFERFRQADGSITRAQGGLGLGLAIVHYLVEMHGGSVGAESPGEKLGATFTVRLPIYDNSNNLSSAIRVHQPGSLHLFSGDPMALKDLKVLVVDDESDTREMLKAMLQQYEAQVVVAATAAEAIEVFNVWKPNILILDIGMPGEDGYSLIRKIRMLEQEKNRRVPALALTAYARSEDRVRALSAGFQMHLSKPVDPAELITAIVSFNNASSPFNKD
jgi:PAS domain S-box-containing protein